MRLIRLNAVRDCAALINAKVPSTVKTAINETVKDLKERGLEAISTMINACFDSNDRKEGRVAFKEKRKPGFKGV